ncbi:hypothetical protein L211DRAFT_849093 [Terfezia boudieri ATCC MYA-4762]|uniref:Uncharacterized protein n=1 Tax=Terfezia boudieri ATCC MYA-4762 TaxID=1051890 RepID=A0A3N4LUP9_9PEZI|nr:hypothetical protein L211DRAFT_849093 [Terfezia boudieri ATCC MYA-4762]
MGKNDKLFFPIQQGWDTNKVAAIIDGKAYRTLGSYSVWGTSGGRPDIRKHIDAISKGAILFDSDNAALPSRIEVIEPAHLDTLIESGKAALVALVLEDQQMNDTINVLPHTTCQVSYCNKPLQPTTPEEDVDMLIRGERESDPELEEVLNKELTGMTVEDRVIELRLALEDDQARRKEEKEEERELREKEISDLMCYICELQKEYREGHGEVMGALAIQVNDIREALSLLNRHMANQIKSLSKQVAELTTQSIVAPPPPPPPPPPPAMSLITVSEKPSRDSFVVGNAPICNLGASGAPLEYSKYGDVPTSMEPSPASSSASERALDIQMANNEQACQPGTDVSIHAGIAPKASLYHQTQGERKTDIRRQEGVYDRIAGKKPVKRDTAPLSSNRPEDQLEDKPKTAETKVTDATQTSAQKGVIRHIEAFRGHNSNRKPASQSTPGISRQTLRPEDKPEGKPKTKVSDAIQTSVQKGVRQSAPGTNINRRTPGTGANAIQPRTRQEDAADLASGKPGNDDETQLVEGKPGRIQRTSKGNKGYWNKGPENTADISPPPSRPTSVQVLITGCPTIPARGDEWKRSFLAGFNARRERLAPETPICATQVSFAVSYPTERVITIHHPPNTKYEEIIRAVARETTELMVPGLQGTRGEKAWDRADAICKSLKLVRSVRPSKWLVKGKGDGYEGKKCSLRFSVTTASLRAIKSPLPIVHNDKSRIYLYQRVDDKAFYVDEMNYRVSEPQPSHSPEPIQTWGACTYCHKINHTEDKCWSKRNADAWRSHNKY